MLASVTVADGRGGNGMSTTSVVVAGGGLGGLCLAQGLRRRGVAVTVLERDPSPAVRGQGYRIHLDPDGLAALRHCLPEPLAQQCLATANRPGPARIRILD